MNGKGKNTLNIVQFREHLLISNFFPGTGGMMLFNGEVKLLNMHAVEQRAASLV